MSDEVWTVVVARPPPSAEEDAFLQWMTEVIEEDLDQSTRQVLPPGGSNRPLPSTST